MTDRERLIELFHKMPNDKDLLSYDLWDVSEFAEDIADWLIANGVTFRENGEWVFGELDVFGRPVHCSACGWGSPTVNQQKWLEYPGHKMCGNCGADMRGKGDSNGC